MTQKIKIAAVQMHSGDDIQANLAAAVGYIKTAAEAGAALVALPECFALMARNVAQLRAAAEAHGGGTIQDAMREAARANGVWIAAGSTPLQSADPKRVFNASLLYDSRGECVARYDKMHLFDVDMAGEAGGESHCESAYTMPGDECITAQSPAGVLGLSVCYDLRFPELYRRLSARGAEVLLVPSAFMVGTGRAHWLPLLQARAIENFCYVVAAAQVGAHNNGRKTYGHSVMIDAWGGVAAMREAAPGVIFGEVDLAKAEKIRRRLPSLQHRVFTC